jgi:MFS family permease
VTVGSLARRVLVDVTPLRRSADYRRLWSSQVLSGIGSQVTAVAVPLQIYAQTRSSFLVGLAGLAALVPLVGFGLLGGAVVDAVDRRRLLLATTAVMAVASGLLVAQALAGLRSVPLLYALLAVTSGAAALDLPARRAVIRRLLPPEQITAANALSQVLMSLCLVLGPLLAGLLVALDVSVAYAVDAVSYAVAVYAVWRLPPMRPEGGGTPAGLASVAEGLRYLRTRPVLTASFQADLIAMVFGMPRALFPALATGHFGGGSGTAGLLYAAPAMGALLGGVLSGPLGAVRRQGLGVVVSIVVWGGAIALFGVVRALWLAVALLAVAGAADMVSAVFRNTMLVVSTPDAMIGRLGGVFTVVVAGGPRLGDVEAGAVAALAGPTVSVVSGGLACIVGVLLLAVRTPAFVRYDARAAQLPR